MSKHKQTSRNPLIYWWNELLFARYFEYESDLSLEAFAENLNRLAHSQQGWIWGLEKTVKVTMHPNNKGLDFDVQSRRRRLFDPIGITTARTLGTAQVDSGTGQLLVQGDVKLGRFFHIFLLGYIALIVSVYVPIVFNWMTTATDSTTTALAATVLAMALPIIMLAIFFGGLWWRIYNDRNQLADLIEASTYAEKFKHSASGLADNNVAADWYTDEHPQQSVKKR